MSSSEGGDLRVGRGERLGEDYPVVALRLNPARGIVEHQRRDVERVDLEALPAQSGDEAARHLADAVGAQELGDEADPDASRAPLRSEAMWRLPFQIGHRAREGARQLDLQLAVGKTVVGQIEGRQIRLVERVFDARRPREQAIESLLELLARRDDRLPRFVNRIGQ